MVIWSNRDLQSSFRLLNKRFFNSACPTTTVCKFVDPEDIDYDDGESSGEEIWINSDLRRHPDLCLIVLLHEMTHVAQPDYIGWPKEERHGSLNQALIGELYKKGAYDGLL